MILPRSIQNLIHEFNKLPGIGPKTSERLVFSLLQRPKEQLLNFAQAIQEFTTTIHLCSICFNFTNNGEYSVCSICMDIKRDRSLICVVADSLDLIALEAAGYKGVYHVLGGVIKPFVGITKEHLRVQELFGRISTNPVSEIILAFDPNQEGELTYHALKRELAPFKIKITRLGRGLPQGGDLDYADEITLGEALKGRREM